MRRTVLFLLLAAASVAFVSGALGAERVPAEVVRALGTNRGKSVSSGLVFIDGKYLNPPYRVSRVGNQIQINDRPVTGQLVPWESFVKTQPPSKQKVTEVEESVETPAEAPTPTADGEDPAAPKDGGNAPPADAAVRVRRRIVTTFVGAGEADLDDFKPNEVPEKMKLTDIPPDSEADKARQKRAEAEKDESDDEEEPKAKAGDGQTAKASTVDANGDEIDPASPEGEAAAKAAAAAMPKPAVKTRKVYSLDGAFEVNARSRKLMKPIDAYRARLESTLRRGGYLFFGTSSRKYVVGRTSEAMASKELLRKLPELMRDAESAEALCDSTRSAGLMSYITHAIAQDLYRNKTDYYALIQRRRELADDEKMQKMLNHGR